MGGRRPDRPGQHDAGLPLPPPQLRTLRLGSHDRERRPPLDPARLDRRRPKTTTEHGPPPPRHRLPTTHPGRLTGGRPGAVGRDLNAAAAAVSPRTGAARAVRPPTGGRTRLDERVV